MPPQCHRSRTQRPLGPKHTKFSRAWCPKGWRCPVLGVSTQTGARQWGKGCGLCMLGAELVKVALEVVLAQLRWGKLVWRSIHSYQHSAFPSTAFLPLQKVCRVPRGPFCHRPCPFPALFLFPPPEIANTRHRFWVPGSWAGPTRWKEKLFASGSFSENAETAAKPPQRGDAAQVSPKNAALQRMRSVPGWGHVRGWGQGQPCNTQPSETCS